MPKRSDIFLVSGSGSPLLLVSSRNADEALKAVKGGADIVDVKNPSEGSLGANFPWVITEIRKAVPPTIPVSAAIGDFPNLPGSAALAALGALTAGANIIKVGLKGPKNAESAAYLVERVVKAVKDVSKSAKVVACAYGDSRIETVDPLILPEIVHRAGADVAMVDTAVKNGRPLTDFLRTNELKSFVDGAHSYGLLAAIAGSLGFDEVRTLKSLDPDVIGVRGTVCEGGNREGGISEKLVRRMKSVLER